jgi:amino acid permease
MLPKINYLQVSKSNQGAQDIEACKSDSGSSKLSQASTQSSDAPKTGVGLHMMIFTLLGTRLGTGIVGVPYATLQVGFVVAIIMQIAYIPISIFAIWLLIQAKNVSGKSSISELGIYWYGRYSVYFINFFVGIAQFGFWMIFFIVFGDVAGGLIEKIGLLTEILSHRVFTHSLLGISLVYLILLKDIKSLRYAGLVILSLITLFLLLFILHYFISNPNPEKEVEHENIFFSIKTVQAIPTFLATYAFHVTFFSALSTLRNPTDKKGLWAIIASKFIAFSVYVISPAIAFELYGHKVGTNMLKNVSQESGILPTILQIIFLVIAVMHIPIIFYIGKENVLIVFDQLTRGSYTPKLKKNEERKPIDKADLAHIDAEHHPVIANDKYKSPVIISPEKIVAKAEVKEEIIPDITFSKTDIKTYLGMKPVFYYLITLVCFLTIVVCSIVVGDVGIFFKIIGWTVGAFIYFIAPATFYIISVKKTKTELKTVLDKLTYIGAWAMTAAGFLVSLIFITLFI